jgi:hypothetical protein
MKWSVSDVFDDGHWGIIRENGKDFEIVIGGASPLTEKQAKKICDIHNSEEKLV